MAGGWGRTREPSPQRSSSLRRTTRSASRETGRTWPEHRARLGRQSRGQRAHSWLNPQKTLRSESERRRQRLAWRESPPHPAELRTYKFPEQKGWHSLRRAGGPIAVAGGPGPGAQGRVAMAVDTAVSPRAKLSTQGSTFTMNIRYLNNQKLLLIQKRTGVRTSRRSMVQDPPASAGDPGSAPDPGRSRPPQSS